MQTVRTTIRLRKDLFDQSKLLALKKGTSFQQVVNDTLASGFREIGDLSQNRIAMAKIDRIRNEIFKKHGKINVQKLVDQNKKELQERTDRLLKTAKNNYGRQPE